MDRPNSRIANSSSWLEEVLGKTDHVLVKNADGSVFCLTHKMPAEKCAPKRQDDTVLQERLDGGTYVLTVVRVTPYRGQLTLRRGDSVVLEREVPIAYDAPFGPDAQDVQNWRESAEHAADADYRRRGEEPPHG